MQTLPQVEKSMLLKMPDGIAGIDHTLRTMVHLTRSGGGRASMHVRQTALAIVGQLPEKDRVAEARAVHAWVRDNIRYVRDVRNVETLQTPERTLKNGQGDCDDKSMLTAALLESLGHKTRFEAVGFVPGKCSHVLASVHLLGRWVPLETTMRVGMGWFPPNVRSLMIKEV